MSIDNSIEMLCSLSRDLNALTTRVTEVLKHAEAELNDAGVGVESWVQLPPGSAGEFDAEFGWAKTDRWGFCCRDSEGPDEGHYGDIFQTARQTRIAAFGQLHELLDNLTRQVKEHLSAFDEVKDSLPPPQSDYPETETADGLHTPECDSEVPF